MQHKTQPTAKEVAKVSLKNSVPSDAACREYSNKNFPVIHAAYEVARHCYVQGTPAFFSAQRTDIWVMQWVLKKLYNKVLSKHQKCVRAAHWSNLNITDPNAADFVDIRTLGQDRSQPDYTSNLHAIAASVCALANDRHESFIS
jgi:hypothetical protein